MSFSFKKSLSFRPHLSLAHWWVVSLLSVFVVTAALTASAIVTFIRASRADVADDGVRAPVESVSREALDDTLAAFAARAERFEGLKNSYESVADPSR